jgi:hypothetical protein
MANEEADDEKAPDLTGDERGTSKFGGAMVNHLELSGSICVSSAISVAQASAPCRVECIHRNYRNIRAARNRSGDWRRNARENIAAARLWHSSPRGETNKISYCSLTCRYDLSQERIYREVAMYRAW